MGRSSRRSPALVSAACWFMALSAVAPAALAQGPTLSQPERRIDTEPAPAETPAKPPPPRAPAAQKATPPLSHKKGPPPTTPRATLPPGVLRGEPEPSLRQAIGGSAPAQSLRGHPDDPELSSLAAAERVLFPKPLRGIEPGWSWSIDPGAPEVSSTLTPPSIDVTAPNAAVQADNDAAWLNSLTMPDLPVRLDDRVIRYLKFYRDTKRGRAIGRAWVKKSGRYIVALSSEFQKARLPRDLIWLSLIESGHNPTIHSPAGAAGLWQFIPSTARMYGLTVDRWVDERLDPQRSTQAAARFLSDLYRRFGSWELAMAAYNMGYAGLSRAIKKFNTNDFWELCRHEAGIPWETTLYVPKIFAIAIVMNNKKMFGLDDVVPDPPQSFDTVLLEPGRPLGEVAKLLQLDEDGVAELNPQYLVGRTPPQARGAPRRHAVRVPKGHGIQGQVALAGKQGPTLDVYEVRFGDTVDSIAEEQGASLTELRSLNRLAPTESLDAGTALILPEQRTPPRGTTKEVVVTSARRFSYPERQRVFYRVLVGDTLTAIAHAFGVAEGDLLLWNAIDESARLQEGMALQVFVDDKSRLRSVRHIPDDQAQLLVVGTPAFYNYYEGQKGKERLVIAAKKGDTLASIGKRYDMSVGWMERVNRRSRGDMLRPGEQIVVYANRVTAGDTEEAEQPALSPLPDPKAPRPELLPTAPPARAAKQVP